MEKHISEPRINDRIRVPEVRLVGPNGEQVGIVRVEDALRLAAEADLDLVEVAPMAKPPVAKLMDFGKYKYEAAMKAREARKNQVNTVIKEIKLRPKIDPHDYGTKKGHVERFLKGGDKVKVTIMFRGREQSRPELGFRLLQRLAEDVLELGTVESAPKQDGRNMVMVIAPTKKKAQAMAEQRRKRDESGTAPRGRTDEVSRPAGADRALSARPSRPSRGVDRGANRGAPSTGPRPPGADRPPERQHHRNTQGDRHHAEEQDAQRREEALPGDRVRQGHARAGRPRPQVPREEPRRRPAPSAGTSS